MYMPAVAMIHSTLYMEVLVLKKGFSAGKRVFAIGLTDVGREQS
jgi:hypothetical protein